MHSESINQHKPETNTQSETETGSKLTPSLKKKCNELRNHPLYSEVNVENVGSVDTPVYEAKHPDYPNVTVKGCDKDQATLGLVNLLRVADTENHERSQDPSN